MSITLAGNFTQNGGTFVSTSTTQFPLIAFSGGAPSALTQSAGSFTPANIDWRIASGKVVTLNTNGGLILSAGRAFTVNGRLNFAPGTVYVGGAGNFTLSSGATLGVASGNGVDAGTLLGNIRVSGTRTFDPGASYEFVTSLATGTPEPTGTGFPTVVNSLIFSNGAASQGLSLASALTVNGRSRWPRERSPQGQMSSRSDHRLLSRRHRVQQSWEPSPPREM